MKNHGSHIYIVFIELLRKFRFSRESHIALLLILIISNHPEKVNFKERCLT